MPLGPGDHVTDNVRLLRLLGRGGMGSVWVAEHLSLDVEVAVKFVAAELLEKGDPVVVERFRREARLAARLDSPHVVRVHDHGITADGTPYIVMELLRGESLAERLARCSKLAPEQAISLVTQIAEGLARAHSLGIVHRDIKPHNVFLVKGAGAEETVKILDFGIAKAMASQSAVITTSSGVLIGTPQYMSPEALMRAVDPDHHVDLWALSVVAYEALVGRPPFRGETLAATLVAITRAHVEPPSTQDGDLSKALDAWFARALHVDQEKRFGDVKALAATFAAAARGEAPPDESARPKTPRTLAASGAGGPTATVDATAGTAEFLARSELVLAISAGPQGDSAPRPVADADPAVADTQRVATDDGAPAARTSSWGVRSGAPREVPGALAEAPPARRSATAALVGLGAVILTGLGIASFAVDPAESTPAATSRLEPPAPSGSAPPAAWTVATAVPAPPSSAGDAAPERMGAIAETEIPEGFAPQTRLWVPAFRVTRAVDDEGATLLEAQRACERRGLSLCTDAQWTRACDVAPQLGRQPSWTLTADPSGFVTRGGNRTCGSRGVVSGERGAVDRAGACCSRAVSVTAPGDNRDFLVTTSRLLGDFERAMNLGSAQAIGSQLADEVSFLGRDTKKDDVVKTLLWEGRSKGRVLYHERCDTRIEDLGKEKRTWVADCTALSIAGQAAALATYRYVRGDDALIEIVGQPKNPVLLFGPAQPKEPKLVTATAGPTPKKRRPAPKDPTAKFNISKQSAYEQEQLDEPPPPPPPEQQQQQQQQQQ